MICLCSLAGLFAMGFLQAQSASDALTDYCASLKVKFPNVPTVTPSELAALQNTPLLLDVREAGEFAVSHLAGAHRAEENVVAQLDRLGIRADSPIVVYCSVGYRSSLLAVKLQEAGFQNVRNLEGSLFAWANAGLPLVNAGGPAEGAHPYSILWGRFLERSKWRWKP